MFIYLLIALGGAIGSMARYGISEAIGLHSQTPIPAIPWGTLVVNITGSFAIGFLSTYIGPGGKYFTSNEARLFFITGICGGYTTFSAFSLETLNLLRAGDTTRAAAYIASSVGFCLLGTWLGFLLGTSLSGSR